MFFSKNLNKLVKLGFALSVIVTAIFAFMAYSGSSFFSMVDPYNRAGVALLVIAVGLILSLLLWGGLGTLTEIALELHAIRERQAGSGSVPVSGGSLKKHLSDLEEHMKKIGDE